MALSSESQTSLRMYMLAAAMALLAVAFAGFGWAFYDGGALSYWDRFYKTLSVVGFSDTYGNLDRAKAGPAASVLLEVARILGGVALIAFAVRAVLDLIAKGFLRWRAARTAGTNAIIIGSGGLAQAAAEAASARKRPALAARIARVAHLGADTLSKAPNRVFSLPWDDAGRKATMVEAFVKKAEFVLVAEPDDAETLALAMAAQSAEPQAMVTAVVRDSRLAEDYADLLAAGGTAHPLRVLSAATLAARDLHLNHPPFLAAKERGQDRIHAVIVGFGDTGEAIARDLAVNCVALGLGLPRLTVIDPQIETREKALRQRVPELNETVQWVPLAGAFGCGQAPPPALTADVPPVTHVYLCLSCDSDTLAAAGAVRQWLRLSGQTSAPLFVRLRDASLLPADPTGEVTRAFGDTRAIVDLSQWLNHNADEAAAWMHAFYAKGLDPRRREAHRNDTARAWAELAPDAQRSNRAVFAHLSAKLASAGVDPTLWRGEVGLPRLFAPSGMLASPDRLEAFAALEHDRWNAERRWAGWCYVGTPRAKGGEKNPTARLHPSLVPFAELSDQDKGYDRQSIRGLEQLLTTGELPNVAGWPEPQMIAIPPGRFLRGAPAGEAGSDDDERPQREVSIGYAFALGRVPVTFAEWDAAIAAGAKLPTPDDGGWGRGNRPVINVSWEDAQAYVGWLNERAGLAGRKDAYRLPSEAEWEYACRAGTTTPFSFGETISTDQANYDGNHTYGKGKKGVDRQQTTPVGSFPANGFGLQDMHGNVWEWCQDVWNDSYARAPSDGSANTTGGRSSRVLRGGSWFFIPLYLRSAHRSGSSPTYRDDDVGFRLARTLLTS